MKILAIIAARTGSKGLRHKNVRVVGGMPLLTRAVKLARASVRKGEQWRIVVSTDSERYARIARSAGADVISRPKRLATDDARLIDVVLHAIDGTPCDYVLLLSATTPLTNTTDVRRLLAAVRRHRVGVATVCPDTPAALRFHLTGERLRATTASPPGRRQDEPACWRLNGALYAASPSWLTKHQRFVVAGKSVGVPMPKRRSLDIDDADDLAIASAMLGDS